MTVGGMLYMIVAFVALWVAWRVNSAITGMGGYFRLQVCVAWGDGADTVKQKNPVNS